MIKHLFNNNISPFIVMGIILLLTQLSACNKEKPVVAPPPPPKVVTTPVLEQTVPFIMQFPGTVTPYKEVAIKPRVSGYVGAHQFLEGSFVKKGDLLYEIDPQPFQATLDAANAKLEQDKATLAFWTSELKRYNKLVKRGAISKEKRDTTATRKKEFLATINQDKADIQQAKLDLGYAHITAPFDGWIQKTKVYDGAVVSKQVTELTTLIALDPIYVIFNLSRQEAYIIQQLSKQGLGPKKRSDMTGSIILSDGTAYPQEGHVDFTNSSFNPNTDTMEARVIFPNKLPDDADNNQMMLSLIPGQYVPLNLTVGHRPNSLLIPKTALIETQEGSFVFTVDKDNKVKKQMVTTGVAYKGSWIIKKGLKKGDVVVSQGTQKIKKSGVQVSPVKAKKDKPE